MVPARAVVWACRKGVVLPLLMEEKSCFCKLSSVEYRFYVGGKYEFVNTCAFVFWRVNVRWFLFFLPPLAGVQLWGVSECCMDNKSCQSVLLLGRRGKVRAPSHRILLPCFWGGGIFGFELGSCCFFMVFARIPET